MTDAELNSALSGLLQDLKNKDQKIIDGSQLPAPAVPVPWQEGTFTPSYPVQPSTFPVELIPWGVLLLVFFGMLILNWRVVSALDKALARLSFIPTPIPPAAPTPLPPVQVELAPIPSVSTAPARPSAAPPVAVPPRSPVPLAPPAPAPLRAPLAVPVPNTLIPITTGAYAGAPPWFQWALLEIGFHETGKNQGINRYISIAKTGAEGDPWCAIFANAALESVGLPGTRSASSQSFRTNFNFVQLDAPALGCIVVFWRGSRTSGLGHVGFYRGEGPNSIWTLGGNEDDMVQIEALPKDSATFGVIGYWWPKSVPLPTTGPVKMSTGAPTQVQTPPVLPKPASSVNGIHTNITATMFHGPTSAYGGPIIDNVPGVALPFHFQGKRPRVRVTGKNNGVSVDCDIVDVGPWNINDPYWTTGTRPQSESGTDNAGRKTNGAGIDLTLAAATALSIDGKGLVDWSFIT